MNNRVEVVRDNAIEREAMKRWKPENIKYTYDRSIAEYSTWDRMRLAHDVMSALEDDQSDLEIANVFDGIKDIPWDLILKYKEIHESQLYLTQDLYGGDPPELRDVLVCSRVAWAEDSGGRAIPSLENQHIWRHGGSLPTTPEGWRKRVIWDYVLSRIEGNIWAEFGVAGGHSACFFLKFLPEGGKFYLLDSFEGLPEEWNGNKVGTFACNVPNFPDPGAIVKKGWFEDTADLPDVLDFVHIDCDIYSATKTVLDKIKVRKGTIILFDELWGYKYRDTFENASWREGEYKALMEWDRPYKFIVRDTHGRAAIEIL